MIPQVTFSNNKTTGMENRLFSCQVWKMVGSRGGVWDCQRRHKEDLHGDGTAVLGCMLIVTPPTDDRVTKLYHSLYQSQFLGLIVYYSYVRSSQSSKMEEN